MKITKERVLIDEGRSILVKYLPELEKIPGYLGWRILETVEFLPRRDHEVEIRALYLLVKISGDVNYKDVVCAIEEIEHKAYKEFAELTLDQNLEGRVNIFIFMDFEEE